MSNVNYLIPKNNRPIWSPDLETLDILADGMVQIPLLGWVAAGQPVDLCDENERVAVPANMVRKNSYALRVRGHSMIDDNIQDGDIIVIEKRETAANGQSVIAMINGETVTLKKFYVDTIVFSVEQLDFLIETFGVDHVLIGTDYPFDMGEYDPVEHVYQAHDLSETDREKICGLNALGLLKRDTSEFSHRVKM